MFLLRAFLASPPIWPSHPYNLCQTEVASRRQPNPAFWPLFLIDSAEIATVGSKIKGGPVVGGYPTLSRRSTAFIVDGVELALGGWPDGGPIPDPGIPDHRSVDRLACATRRRVPGAFQLLPPMRQFVVSDPRAMSSLVVLASGLALASGEKLLLKLSKLSRFSRSSCLLRNQPAVESALSATPWCIRRSEKVRRECSWSHPSTL